MAGGRTGEAAKAVAKIMHPHFVKEEKSTRFRHSGCWMIWPTAPPSRRCARSCSLTDKLKTELPTMLEEHRVIVAALEALTAAATEEKKPEIAEFAG